MDEPKRRFSFAVLIGDGALLLCALAGLTGSFLSLYGSPEAAAWADMPVLARCAAQADSFLALAVVFATLSLCAWSLPRFRGAAAGGLAALWGLFLFPNREAAVQGAGLCVRAITGIFSRRVSWGRIFQYEPGLTSLGEDAAARSFLILALALLALLLGWAVVRARRWWAVLLLTLPPLLPGLLADLYPDWPSFMALAACWCAMLLTGLCRWAAPPGRGRLTLIALPCAAAVLGLITLAFPMEGYTRPPWALEAQEGLMNLSSRAADCFSRWDGPFRGAATYVGAAGEADLAHAGPLRYSGQTVLQVTSGYSGRLYLRGASLAVYEDGVWNPLPEGAYQEYLDNLDGLDSAASPLLFPVLPAGLGQEYTATIDNVGAVGSCVYAPYFLVEQDWEAAGMLPVEDAYLARKQGQWVHTVSFAGAHYDGTDRGGDGYSRNFVAENYLDVPEGLRNTLREMIDPVLACPVEPASEELRYYELACAHRLAAWMEAGFTYDPETPAAPQGVDPVLYFLTESRRGYCMHYASAAVLLLRAMGIPARYASGFTVESVPGQTVSVPDRAAHAWVEVWVDGFGWHPVEVTPAAFSWEEQGAIGPVETEALPSVPIEESGEPEPAPEPSENAQTPGPSEDVQPGAPQEGGDGPGPADGPDWTVLIQIAKALAPVAGASALLWLGQRLPKRYRAKRLDGPDRNRAALDGYGYLRRMEKWDGRVDPRAVELAQKARFSQHTLTQEELGEMRAFVDRERGRLCVVLGPVERLAFRYCWGMPKPPKMQKNSENHRENGANHK